MFNFSENQKPIVQKHNLQYSVFDVIVTKQQILISNLLNHLFS